jgi:hypothetical protein
MKKYAKYNNKNILIGGNKPSTNEYCKVIEFVAKFMRMIVKMIEYLRERNDCYVKCAKCNYVLYSIINRWNCPNCNEIIKTKLQEFAPGQLFNKAHLTLTLTIKAQANKNDIDRSLKYEKMANIIEKLDDAQNEPCAQFEISQNRNVSLITSEHKEFFKQSQCVRTMLLLVYFLTGKVAARDDKNYADIVKNHINALITNYYKDHGVAMNEKYKNIKNFLDLTIRLIQEKNPQTQKFLYPLIQSEMEMKLKIDLLNRQ